MKKVSLMLGSLALVLGLSQCNKEKSPIQAGEKQYIELTASNGNDGSKVDVNFLPSVMNLKWEEGDEITVSGGAEGTLTLNDGIGTAQGRFSGEIEKKNNDDLVFSYRKAIPSKGDDVIDFNAQDGTQAWINDNLYLEAKVAYNESGKYRVLMEMPYAVLKLDLSAFGTVEGTTVTISDGTNTASVEGVKTTTKAMYVAVPVAEEAAEKAYTFSSSDWGALKIWTLSPNMFYTKQGESASIGEAIVIEKYVDLGLSVKWATCNLGATYGTTNASWYGDYFMWGSVTPNTNDDCSWATCPSNGGFSTYNSGASGSWRSTNLTNGILNSNVDAAAQILGDGWHMPTQTEWQELYDNTTSEWTTLNGVNGRLFTSTKQGYTSVTLFLPAAGFRSGVGFQVVGARGSYWSSSLHSSDKSSAYFMRFQSNYVNPQINRNFYCGLAVRPVR